MEIELESGNGEGDCGVSVEKGGTLIFNRRDDQGTAHLAWEDLTVVLPKFGEAAGTSKRLLNGLTGFAEPGRIMAIMGPSGSGKTTFLDSLAGRLSRNVVMTGTLLLNGRKRRLNYGVVAYVTQEDVLLGTLTVREIVTYSAYLRLPTTMAKQEVIERVERTISEMGLRECADRVIGNWHLRGISGGEKRRLTIGLETLTNPPLLVLDEPTSGLDTASAFFVVQILRNVARCGRTIISSIHQPSSEVFALFDDLFLLSGGETVYFGEAKTAVQFFAQAGFPCPSRRNPSDHFLRCINSDFDAMTSTLKGSQRLREDKKSSDPFVNMATAEIKTMLVEKYKRSEYATKARARIQQLSTIQGNEVETRSGSQAGWWKQFTTLTRRSFVNMHRDLGYYWLRLMVYIVVSICVGTIYFDVGTGYNAILARASAGGFVAGFMTFMSIGGFPCFVEEMKVFSRERLNGHCGVGVYILSNSISSFPFLVVISVCAGCITYYMVKFNTELSHCLYYCCNLFLCIAITESIMMFVAAFVPNFFMGVTIGTGIIGIMMLTSGYFRLLPDLPKPFWRYPLSYVSEGSWAIQGEYKNDILGLEFDSLMDGDPKLKGKDVLKNMLGISLGHSKWWDLFALLLILLSYRFGFFVVLKFREKGLPLFRSFIHKRTLRHLDERKKPSFPSKRHPAPPHSLSSQEGLSSPIP